MQELCLALLEQNKMEYKRTKTSKGVFFKEDIKPKLISEEQLLTEKKELEKELKILEKEPDEITVPNDVKFSQMDMLEDRKKEINKILGIK